MEHEKYKKLSPANDSEIVAGLALMQTDKDSLKETRRHTNQRLKRTREGIHNAIEARDREDPVFLLTDGRLTTEPPDPQGELFDEGGDNDTDGG